MEVFSIEMDKTFFSHNRQSLIRSLNGGIIVVSAFTKMQRGNDSSYLFEQETNFWWLTGIDSSDWQLVIDGTRLKSWLVAPDVSESHQIFDGSLSREQAQEKSGVDAVITHDEFLDLLRDLAKNHSRVYTLGKQPHAEYLDFTLNPAIRKTWKLLERQFGSVSDCRKELSVLRAVKQGAEIEAIQKAIDLTITGYEKVRASLASFAYEYEVEAEFSYTFRRHGAAGHAYDPIVAAGKNACTLHYIENTSPLVDGQLLLLDIGARYNGYAADITRTYARGDASARQRQVHAVVQRAHREIITIIQPDLLIEEYHAAVDTIMKAAVMELGLMTDVNDEESYRRYFPHAISHGLGLDVHDSLGAPKYLRENMILTVEPGIYIPEESIGVRIEDDILVTANGQLNLSEQLSTDL